ncbi:Probable F-box protein At3g61730 [Linum grandiflorum]
MRTGKRFRRERSICSCKSPRLTYQASPRSFYFYELDAWTEIAKFLDGKSMVKLASTCKWFHGVIMQDSVWKFACLSHFQVPAPDRTEFKWIELYASAINGSHSYTFRETEKHLDWMRIGAFFIDSPSVILTQRLNLPLKIMKRETLKNMLRSTGACLLDGLRKGIWIADLQLVRCPVCELDTCEVEDQEAAASAAMLDLKHIRDGQIAEVFNLKLWGGRPNDFQPKAMITYHAVAISTLLQANQAGLVSKFYVMRAGAGGEVVSIRISQQLL